MACTPMAQRALGLDLSNGRAKGVRGPRILDMRTLCTRVLGGMQRPCILLGRHVSLLTPTGLELRPVSLSLAYPHGGSGTGLGVLSGCEVYNPGVSASTIVRGGVPEPMPRPDLWGTSQGSVPEVDVGTVNWANQFSYTIFLIPSLGLETWTPPCEETGSRSLMSP